MKKTQTAFVYTAVCALMASMLFLTGCGSTKVYTADKTLVYKDSLYNLTQVQQLGSQVDVKLPTGESVDSNTLDKSRINSLLKEHDSLTMTTLFMLDDKELIYERVNIDSYSKYSKHLKRFEQARKNVTSFMSDAKKTQLKLK